MQYDPTSNTIYLPGHSGVWRVYHPCPILPATSYWVGFSQHLVSPFPPLASATHWTLVDHIRQGPLFAFGLAPAAPWHPPTPPDLFHILEDLGPCNWPLQYSHFPLEGTHLALAILLGHAHGVCDGSYMPSLWLDLGAATWFLEDSSSPGHHTCYGSLHSTGGPGISNAYQSKLQGMHAMLLAIQSICQAFSLSSELYIQVCDDSTNKTCIAIIEDEIIRWQEKGTKISRLERPDQVGFKAGNLSANFHYIQGEFVVYLDEDHWLEKDFLRDTIPHFYDNSGRLKDHIGLVQTPWSYYNTHQNLLTECGKST